MEYLDDKLFVLRQEVPVVGGYLANEEIECLPYICLLYTSDAADEL